MTLKSLFMMFRHDAEAPTYARRGMAVTEKRDRFRFLPRWRPELSDKERERLSKEIGL